MPMLVNSISPATDVCVCCVCTLCVCVCVCVCVFVHTCAAVWCRTGVGLRGLGDRPCDGTSAISTRYWSDEECKGRTSASCCRRGQAPREVLCMYVACVYTSVCRCSVMHVRADASCLCERDGGSRGPGACVVFVRTHVCGYAPNICYSVRLSTVCVCVCVCLCVCACVSMGNTSSIFQMAS